MAPLPPRRRVSYGVPFPPSAKPIPLLWLPPLGFNRQGSVDPILVSNSDPYPNHGFQPHQDTTPRHRLGVSSLALDTTTQLIGRPSPEGILYTGGRDGLVIAWDLKIPMRKPTRTGDVPRPSSTRWELVTGWTDPITDDLPEEDEDIRSDGDILGEVRGSARRRKLSSAAATSASIPLDHMWELDVDAFRPGQPSTFRQAAQVHSDWVNDILLCNRNQTLVSASSDGTVKAWSPHSSPLSDPITVGTHADYVRCLAHSREQGWVASGSFDRTVKLWDLSRASQATTSTTPHPIMTLTPPEASGAKTSIYALAVDPLGHMIVSGGPERVVRMWDPRAGKRIGKLVGHTDNIRAILVSEDSRCLLTASADASIKLWSLTSQRCLHTFTHHTDSVWALHSSHPSLEIFYSGDKSGFVARVDVEGCAHMSEAECALVCQDVAPPAEGVTKLVALEDTLVWTASGSSSLRRWRAPPRRAVRAAAPVEPPASATSRTTSRLRPSRSTDWRPRSITLDLPPSTPIHRQPRHTSSLSTTSPPTSEPPRPLSPEDGTGESETSWFGLPYDCLVHLASPLGDQFTPFSPVYRGRGAGADADVATLYSAASLMSVSPRPLLLRTPLRGIFPSTPSPPHSPPSIGRPVSPAHSDFAPSTSALGAGGAGNGAGGSGVASGTGLGPHRSAFEAREIVAEAQPLSPVPDFVLVGGPGLVRAALLSNRVHALTVDTAGIIAVWDIVRAMCVGQFAREDVLLAANASNNYNVSGSSASHHEEEGARVCSPREALDVVRERIDGEAFVVPWSSVDTAMGVLNVHLDEHAFDAELYADELGLPPDHALLASLAPDDVRINLGKWILRNLFQGFIYEQEQAHARRLRAAAMTPPRTTGNIPTALSPPPPHSPQHPQTNSAGGTKSAPADSTATSSVVIVARNMLPALSPIRPVGLGIPHVPLPHTQLSPTLTAAATPHAGSESTTQAQAQPSQHPGQGNVGAAHQHAPTEASATAVATQIGQDYFTAPTRRPSVSKGGAGATPMPAPVPTVQDDSGPSTGTTGAGANIGVESSDAGAGNGGGATPGTPGGGFIGKLRGFGRATKRAQNESALGTPGPAPRTPGPTATGAGAGVGAASSAGVGVTTIAVTVTSTTITTGTTATATTTTTASSGTPTPQETPAKTRTAAQVVLASGMLSPPTAAEAPTLGLAPEIPLLIAEERAHGWAIAYRGTVASVGAAGDVAMLEDAMPTWLLEYLLLGRAPLVAVVKIQFALLPGEEQLPELVNPNQTKLSASRFLRVRKLALHVQERLESMGFGTPGRGTPHASPRPSTDPHNQPSSQLSSQMTQKAHGAPHVAAAAHEQNPANQTLHPGPDDLWEISCNDTVLPPNMTLAVVRQYVWRQSGEVVLYYRRKRQATHRKDHTV